MTIKEKLNCYSTEFNARLSEFFPLGTEAESRVVEAMKYSVTNGGKRLRPFLVNETAGLFGLTFEETLRTAVALECLHSYSLIHDDLPAMDNDDLRRGKPTNHKVFGEAIAVLAGDALISFGAKLIIDKLKNFPSDVILDILDEYLKTAGAQGIVAGQVADIEAENKKIDIENLKYIHKYKTGALFKCSMLIAAKLAQVNDKIMKNIEKYADNFGVLFQIYDDIIDCTLTTQELGKTAGKDANVHKLTYVSAYGIDGAKNIFNNLVKENYDILMKLDIKSDVFDEIYELLNKRINN